MDLMLSGVHYAGSRFLEPPLQAIAEFMRVLILSTGQVYEVEELSQTLLAPKREIFYPKESTQLDLFDITENANKAF